MIKLSKPLKLATLICLIGSGFVATSLLPNSMAQAAVLAKAATNGISNVEVASLAGDKLSVKFTLGNAISAPAAFSIANPPRIAIDFVGVSNQLGKSTVSVNQGLLRNITLVEAGPRTRAVLNLTRNATYTTQVDGNQVTMVITPSALAEKTTMTNSVTSTLAAGGSDVVRDIDFRRGANGEGKVIIDLANGQSGVDVRREGEKIIVDIPSTSLPSNLQKRLDVTDFATMVQSVDAFSRGNNTRLVIVPKGDWEFSAYQTNSRIAVEVRKSGLEDAKLSAKPKKVEFKGEKLTLNFQNVTVREVLQAIAEFTGKNIITSDTVQGSLTLRLKDVPWDQALDLILNAKGLDKRQNGNVIWVAPRDELVTREKAELEARKQITELEPLRAEAFQLKYLKASDFKKLLEESAKSSSNGNSNDRTGFLSGRGSAIMADKANILFITDTAAKLEEVRELLNLVDVPSRQVSIEARIVEANDDFSKDIGVRLGFMRSNKGFTLGNSVDNALAIHDGGVSSSTLLPQVNLPGTAGNTSSIGALIGSSLTSGLLSLELNALEADGRGKIISNPRVVTSNQVEALIEQGTDVPYSTSSQAGTKTEFKKAVLSLKVLPQITPDGNLIMRVEVHKDSVIPTTPGQQPSIDTKVITTEVQVENGGTIVIGGIYSESDSNVVSKTPLLGDIPILGNLFKNKSMQTSKKELLIFITPRILDDKLTIR